jgi:hypothetical protein
MQSNYNHIMPTNISAALTGWASCMITATLAASLVL